MRKSVKKVIGSRVLASELSDKREDFGKHKNAQVQVTARLQMIALLLQFQQFHAEFPGMI